MDGPLPMSALFSQRENLNTALEGTTLKYYLHITPSPLESNQLDILDLKYGTPYPTTCSRNKINNRVQKHNLNLTDLPSLCCYK